MPESPAMSTQHKEDDARGRSSGRDDFVAVDKHLFYWLTKSVNRRNTALARALAPLKCTVPRWRVMNLLREHPSMSIAQLANETAVDRTTLTRTINGLETDGLLARCARPANRRIVDLSLTRRGHHFYQRILPVVREEDARALEGIAVDETSAAMRLLQKLALNLGDPVT